jgi:hemerythrin superfamily protein
VGSAAITAIVGARSWRGSERSRSAQAEREQRRAGAQHAAARREFTITGGKMNILDKLHEEHEMAKSLLTQMQDTKSGPKRLALFKQFKTAIVKHSRAEEKVVYTPLKKADDEDAQVDAREGFIEHHLVDALVIKFSATRDKAGEDATALIKVMKELLEHHIEEEEDEVWAKVRALFSPEQQEKMTVKFEAEKKKVRA